MITDERLKWLSNPDYATSEPGQIAAELVTARARIAYLEGALRVIADGTICPDLFPNDTDENVIAAKTAMVTAIAALEHSESETGTKFTAESRYALCIHCGKTFFDHSNFDASCVTSSKSCSDARPQGQEDPGERTHPKAPVQISTERSVTGGQAADSPCFDNDRGVVKDV